MNLVEFWQAPIRRILGAKDLPSKDAHREADFVARAHRLLKGRDTVKNPESNALLSKIQLARIAIESARKKTDRLTRWTEQAKNELIQAQARGDDLLRELCRLEHAAN